MSNRQITCFRDLSELTEAAARLIADRIRACIEKTGTCSICLSGGGTPGPVYERLAKADLADQIDWARVLISFGDERCVPPDSELSNYKMAKEALLDQVPIPSGNTTRIQGELEPQKAADIYAGEVGDRTQDIVILGMGEDGHVASLFPHTPGLDDRSQLVVVTRSPVPPTRRISITLRVINRARSVIFLIAGEKKARILSQVFKEREGDYPRLPAARVQPRSGSLLWLIDQAAAGELGFEPKMESVTNF